MKIISKYHNFHHISQKTGQAPKRPKWGHITRTTTITTNNDTRHIKCSKLDISELDIKVDKFQGGNMRNNSPAWTNITSDTFILNIAQEVLKLSFKGEIPTKEPFEF